MRRADLEHIIRAAGTIADDEDIIVIGSQAILGQYPDAPEELLISREADVFPLHHPGRADLIDGSIGEGSPFERSFGYYAHGVGEETAVLPEGWRDRLVLISNVNTRHIRGWCLEVHDLAIAKLVAGREKDLDFLQALLCHRLAVPGLLRQRLNATCVEPALAPIVNSRLEAALRSVRA
jgi:hypothetical protein